MSRSFIEIQGPCDTSHALSASVFEANREKKAPRTPAIAFATVWAKAAGVDNPAQRRREPLVASEGYWFCFEIPARGRIAREKLPHYTMPMSKGPRTSQRTDLKHSRALSNKVPDASSPGEPSDTGEMKRLVLSKYVSVVVVHDLQEK
jgi:hypothetical protein